MSYRCVIVSNPAHISTRSEQLVVETDERHTVPIEDISALMLESRRATLSAAALSALAQNGTAVFVCDEKHLPCGVLLPYAQHSRQLKVLPVGRLRHGTFHLLHDGVTAALEKTDRIRKHRVILLFADSAAARAQLSLTLPAKKRFWQQLVTAKIGNQAECLALCGKTQEAVFLHSRARAVTSGDKDNLEAAAAAYYFPALFGTGFTRSADDGRNAALNYGYAILRGYAARCAAVYGLLPWEGLHHCSQLNQYNLADDLMEPFRPVVDLYVAANVDEASTLAPALKHALFGLMNADILSGGQHHSVAYAMERLVQSLRTGMEKGGALALPKLLAWQPHGYE